MLFSERMGIKQPKQVLQIDSMDEDLRVSLWNAFYINYFECESDVVLGFKNYIHYDKILNLFMNLQLNYFKRPIDEFEYLEADYNPEKLITSFKNLFFKNDWFKVYELIEFTLQNFDNKELNNLFQEQCKIVLERENSGYRIINKQVVPISSEIEIKEIEESLINSQNEKFKFVNNQLNQAIEHFKNRENPDYKNSIHEAIKAVECLCRLITGESDLGKSLNNIEKFIMIHPQFKSGLEKFYAYTNSKEVGARHAQMLDSNIGFDEAKFMLVFCSAFINYLISKRADAKPSSA